MAKRKKIREIKPYITLYRDKESGIAWIEDGSTGMSHSVHANIDATGSVTGMKKRGFWKDDARCVKSHGYIYNIDTFVCDDELDKIVAEECMCNACITRREMPFD